MGDRGVSCCSWCNDNGPLLLPDGSLNPSLVYHQHYEIIDATHWALLEAEFACPHPISRRVGRQ
jgi:hypothetical protein